MKVAVIGAGGVGGFLAALLSRAGHDVTVLARGAHLAAIREQGLTLKSVQHGEFTVRVSATDDPAELGRNALAIVAVKLYDFANACAAAVAALAPDGVAIPVQNGLDAPDLLATAVGTSRALVGTAQIEVAITAPGTIAHPVPGHRLTLAELNGPPSERLTSLAETLRTAEIVVHLADDGRLALWEKAAFLIPFATLTATEECAFGEIWDRPALKAAWETLRDEAAAVGIAEGYDPRRAVAAIEKNLAGLLPASAGFTSSMNRDFRAKRRTELGWLPGGLMRRAAERGVPVPAHTTLYGVLELREARQKER